MDNPQCRLIIDTRERYVTRHDVEFSKTAHEIKQINIGDYVITTPTDKILAVIERKSYDDFGASLKDGRHNNKEKMLALRRATGCSVILILEGPAFPDPHKTFARIPYYVIESAVFHMQVRDNIHVIRTEDTLHTAQTLARLVKSMSNLWTSYPLDSVLDARVDISGAGNIPEAAVEGGDEAGNAAEAQAGVAVITSATDLLTVKIEKSPRDVARNMWGRFRGISVESADEFLARWSIADLAAGRVIDEIGTMKTAGGRKIGKNVVEAIRGCDRAMEAKILSETPGISLETARKLLATVTLKQLIAAGAASLAEVVVTKNGTKLGPSRAARVFECVNYKHSAPELAKN